MEKLQEPDQVSTGLGPTASDSQDNVPYSLFSPSAKRWTVALIALAGFFSPLSANIYFPALNYVARDLHVSLELINITITAYLICQGLVPSIIGDLADKIGRRPVYLAVFLIYFGANIGLALQDSYPALLVLRILQSCGSSGELRPFSVCGRILTPTRNNRLSRQRCRRSCPATRTREICWCRLMWVCRKGQFSI